MTNEKRVLALDSEIKVLEENPFYQDWIKLKNIMGKGQAIEEMRRRKYRMIHMLVEQDKQLQRQQQEIPDNQDLLGEPLEEDEVPLPPQPYSPPRMQQVKQPQKPQSQPPQPPVRTFDYKKEEVGLDDEPEIEGLPDSDDILEE